MSAPNDAQLILAAHDVVDHLNAIVPLGWTTATVRLGPNGNGLGISKIATQGTPDDSPRRKLIAFDPGRRAILLADTLGYIREGMRARGLVWDGLTVQLFAHENEGVDVVLSTVTGQRLATLRIASPKTELLVTPQLSEYVRRHLDDWLGAEAALEARVGANPSFTWDSEKRKLTLGEGEGSFVCEAEPLGAFESGRSFYSWARRYPRFADEPPGRARALADDGDLPEGLNVWRFPGFHCEEAFARVAVRMTGQLANCLPVAAVADPDAEGVRLYFGLFDSDRYLQSTH